jgi:hypothetical protein
VLEKVKDNLFSILFTAMVSVLFTCILFYMYSQSSSSEEIKKELLNLTMNYISENYDSNPAEVNLDKYLAKEIDLSSNKVIFFFGTLRKNKDELFRWVGVYERKDSNLFDEILGKEGSYEIKSFTMIDILYADNLIFDDIEEIDIDKDGQQEIHIRFKSVWANSRGVAPLILYKKSDGSWEYVGLPSLDELVNMTPARTYRASAQSYTHFGAMESEEEIIEKSVDELKDLNVYGHDWTLRFPERHQVFSSIRNGGGYFFNNHPIKGYFQVLWVSFFIDGNSTLDKHYAVVRVFKYADGKLVVDELWNWGKPVFSGIPLDPTELNVNSLYRAGLLSHLSGDKKELFFGFTEYEKVGVPDGFGQINGTSLR